MKTDNKFSIAKDVPVPEKKRFSGFPFLDMEVGDSFECPAADAIRARSSMQYFKAVSGQTKKFTMRKVSDKAYRIWRYQ